MDKRWEPPRFYWPFGFCGGRHKFPVFALWRRLNTAYHNDRSNWFKCCPVCEEDARQYYQELWDEYYNSRL